jgi:hypothetical protein
MTIIRKTFRIARGTALVLGMVMMLALALGVASVALAAVPGDPFRLGQVNVIGALIQLVGEKTGPMLRIDNNGPGYALQLLVEPNRAPLTVNADAGKAVNLNADELDGKSMLLTGMEICYDTSDPAVALSRVKLLRYSSSNGGGAGGNFVVEDNTPTDGNQCRMYSGTPQRMGTNSFAFLEMHVNWSETTTQTTFSIQRTTFFLEPSNTSAAPL